MIPSLRLSLASTGLHGDETGPGIVGRTITEAGHESTSYDRDIRMVETDIFLQICLDGRPIADYRWGFPGCIWVGKIHHRSGGDLFFGRAVRNFGGHVVVFEAVSSSST